MPVRTVDPQSAELIRKRLEEMRDGPPFNGNMSALARDLGITAAYLSDVLNNQRGPGMKILKALAKRLGGSLDEMIHQRSVAAGPPWSTLPGWQEALQSARVAYPKITAEAWQWVGSLAGVSPPALIAQVLGPIAMVWDQHSTSSALDVAVVAPASRPTTKKKRAASPSADTKPEKHAAKKKRDAA